ncbi:MAG: NAD(P)-dependent oxidoreductase [Acidimicrobiia bacterium]|nr:NAD(P)-dependent oxidoreductase [Acidimicrobiia bacterium]
MSPMKNVLVTGGTGFIGVELVRELCNMGLRPRILVRRPHRAALLSSLEVDLVHGDLRSDESLRRAVDGIDTVFHLGARASFESYRRLRPTIVDGTTALARAAGAAGVEHFVFSSSLFVYGDQSDPIGAATPTSPAIAYGRAKLEAEDALATIAADAGMAVASIRLPHVYGPQSILFDQVRSGFAIFPGGMRNQCGQLHVEDAARALAEVGRQRWTGRSAVADDHIVDWLEFFEILRAFFPRLRLVTLPKSLGIAGATVIEPLLSRRTRPTLYTKDTVVGFNLNVPVEPGLVWSDLAAEPRYPTVREGIPAVLDGNVHFRWRHPLMDRRR